MCNCRLPVILALTLTTSCAVDRAGLRVADPIDLDAGLSTDASMLDAATGPDAGPHDAGPTDADSLDTGSADADSADIGAADAGPPDAGPPDSGPPSCDSQYGAAIGYIACQERVTECEFVSRLDAVRTCGTTCAALGGRCLDAYTNELPYPPCDRQSATIGCDVLHQDDICVCSRGP